MAKWNEIPTGAPSPTTRTTSQSTNPLQPIIVLENADVIPALRHTGILRVRPKVGQGTKADSPSNNIPVSIPRMKMADQDTKIELKTHGFDARFPNTNQTKNCWQNYVDYFKCTKAKGEDYAPCHQFKRAFTSLCPEKWSSASSGIPMLRGICEGRAALRDSVEKWDEQREEGHFPALAERHTAEHH
ncbi:hypothetical protein SpCBS45565_g04868 [Spizellomyces sp. 'palustris']|nr:hypothetical protein SpCBS45565_g04868 [Spizellomyces sp. 'palustris']